MMAAAMAVSNSRPPKYVELARNGAHIQRDLNINDCERLQSATRSIQGIYVDLTFGRDEQNQLRAAGHVSANCELDCQLCDAAVESVIEAPIHLVLAFSEIQAQSLVDRNLLKGGDVVVVDQTLNLAALVEDELLLKLPSQVCTDIDCVNRPALSYGSGVEDDAGHKENPFAVLRHWSKEQ